MRTSRPSAWADSSHRHLALAMGGEVLLYAVAIGLLQYQGWGPKDVVWTLWSTSLVTGYITIVLAIFGGGLRLVVEGLRSGEMPRGRLLSLCIILIGGGLFFLAFFSVHFGMFHAGHATFLNQFFPLVQWPERPAGLVGPMLVYLQECWKQYPVFITVCVLGRIPDWLRRQELSAALVAPYANVVKLHVLILAIGFTAYGDDRDVSAALLVFLAVYFVPIAPLWRLLRDRRHVQGADSPIR